MVVTWAFVKYEVKDKILTLELIILARIVGFIVYSKFGPFRKGNLGKWSNPLC